MFETATLKLTGIYLIIIMIISIFFSINIYRATNSEITNGMIQQAMYLENTSRFRGILNDPDAIHMREDRLDEARGRIIFYLINTNILILVVGGVVSYVLARRTLRPIQEAHDAQVRFTADASHELRTPLAAMQTEIEVSLRDPNLSRVEAIELLKSNLEELGKLAALSDGLLQLAKKDGGLSLKPVKTDIVLGEALKRVGPIAKDKGIKLNNTSKRSYKVMGDKTSLIELMVILLDNAIKYSQAGQVVSVHAGINARHVVMSVRDEGKGIDEADLPHVFERFYRADSSRSTNKTRGHGLGLSIAQKIAHLHQAELSVKSLSDKGSTFMVTFLNKKV